MKTGGIIAIVLAIVLVFVLAGVAVGGFAFYNTNKNLTNELSTVKDELSAVKSERDNLSGQLTGANSQIESLTSQLAEANGEVEGLNSQVVDLGDQLSVSSLRVSAFEDLRCHYSWADFMDFWGYFPLEDANFFTDFPEWNSYVFFTQRTNEEWDNDLPSTTALWDIDNKESFVIDTEFDCILINPDVFPDVGK